MEEVNRFFGLSFTSEIPKELKEKYDKYYKDVYPQEYRDALLKSYSKKEEKKDD